MSFRCGRLLSRIGYLALVSLILLSDTGPSGILGHPFEARASETWRQARRYTAALMDETIVAARAAVTAASLALAQAERNYQTAIQALEAMERIISGASQKATPEQRWLQVPLLVLSPAKEYGELYIGALIRSAM